MILETFAVGPLQCNCTLLGDEEAGEAIIIDPGDEIIRIHRRLTELGLKLKQILITHAHIDHVGGAVRLRKATGAPILLNENDDQLLRMLDVQASWLGMRDPGQVEVDQSPADGDKIRWGTLEATVIHTPGHTQGSICLLISRHKTLIAGDTLFQGSIGRTDLPGGSYDKIIRSIHNKLLVLPGDTAVVPGHGPTTTIEEERERNPFLRVR